MMKHYDLLALAFREARIQKKTVFAMIAVQICMISLCTLLWQISLSVGDTLSAYLDKQYPEGETVTLVGADYSQRAKLLNAGFTDIKADCMGDSRSSIRCTRNNAEISKEKYPISYLWMVENADITAVKGQLWTSKDEYTPAIWLSEQTANELGCDVGDEFVFESYTKMSEEFKVLGIYQKSEEYGDVIINFVPYIQMISEIGIPQNYSMAGTSPCISRLPDIRSNCEKFGVTFSSKAEPWFSSMNMIKILLYGVSVLLTILHWVNLLHFCGILIQNRVSFTVLCCFLGTEKSTIVKLYALLLYGIFSVSALCSSGFVVLGTIYGNKVFSELTGVYCFSVRQTILLFALYVFGGLLSIGVCTFNQQKNIKTDFSFLAKGGD